MKATRLLKEKEADRVEKKVRTYKIWFTSMTLNNLLSDINFFFNVILKLLLFELILLSY